MKRLNEPACDDNCRKLKLFFNERFDSTFLPSHNSDHHLRVWTYAQSIIVHLTNNGFSFSKEFILGLQTACLLHDLGMVEERGENHGKAGKKLAAEFLANSSLPASIKEEVLAAVENHDRKDYTDGSPPESILAVLSVADDLDAYSYTGIYRYIEIYLERGMSTDKISEAVTNNLFNRFHHLVKTYKFLPDLISTHAARYEIARDFFDPNGQFSESSRRKIIAIIDEELLKKHKDIIQLSERFVTANDDHVALFFRSLHKELFTTEHA